MPLPLPTLDRLTYDELVAEARRSLPALAPDWTDYNAHDPGITLIELLAWLTEGASYRLNNIPEESYRAFLRLAGVVPRPPQVAETLLVFQPSVTGVVLPQGIRVQSADGAVQFQTVTELFVSDANLQVVMSIVRGKGEIHEDLTTRNMSSTSTWNPFGTKPQPGDALYLGFDHILAPADSIVSLGIWTGNESADFEMRTRLQEEQDIQHELARICSTGIAAGEPAKPADWREHYGVHTIWEFYDGKEWLALQAVEDDTRALTLTSTVRFKAPAPDQQVRGGIGLPGYDANYFIRCRLAGGSYDCPPCIAYVALNAIVARHAVAIPPQTFISTGRACQRFELASKPVVMDANSIKLTIALKDNAVDDKWQVAPHWDGVGPHDGICVLIPETGTLIFGDGRIGRVPAAESKITVHYQAGGGASGNVATKTLVKLVLDQSEVLIKELPKPFAAYGGAAAETLNQAKARAVRELATPTRAITLNDFETLARATPGVPIARVHAIADYHPAMPCIPVSGSTTVILLPPCPQQRPEPTPALIATVQRYLERRRMLTGEIHVVGPHYSTVSISARLQLKPGIDRRQLIDLAQGELGRYLHPLHGGPDKKGWPIGRAVYRSELLALLNNLDGVRFVEDLTWKLDDQAASRCGNITLCRHGLVASGKHEITINEGSVCHE